MVGFLLDLPAMAGGILTMAVSTTLGLLVYIGSYNLIVRYKTEDL